MYSNVVCLILSPSQFVIFVVYHEKHNAVNAVLMLLTFILGRQSFHKFIIWLTVIICTWSLISQAKSPEFSVFILKIRFTTEGVATCQVIRRNNEVVQTLTHFICVATRVFSVHLLHAVAFSNQLHWFEPNNVIILKMKLHTVNAR